MGDAFKQREIEARVCLAMTEAYNLAPGQKVVVVDQPSKGVFARCAIPKAELVIPVYGKVYDGSIDDVPVGSLLVKAHPFHDTTVAIKPTTSTEHGVTPSAFVRVEHDDESKATADFDWKTMSFFKQLKGHKVLAADRLGMRLPAFINKRELKQDEDVAIYKEPAEKTKKAPSKHVHVGIGPAAKRAKVCAAA